MSDTYAAMSNAPMQQNVSQIIRIDARNSFVESLNDAFCYGKFHLGFTKYDLSRVKGSRQTDRVHIYIDVGRFLHLTQQLRTGELDYLANQFRAQSQHGSLFKTMGGTPAERLRMKRPDGHGQYRIMEIQPGNKPGSFYIDATSGAGDVRGNGIIAPVQGAKPDQRVGVPLSKEGLATLLYVSELHYHAWLTACYSRTAIMLDGNPALNGWNPYSGC